MSDTKQVNTAKPKHKKLGEFFSTAICGNDILSSALYVSGIAALFAGVYAPLVLAAVCLVLYFYKSVYREVVETLPINGGAYNALLNATSKFTASIAGVMTVLSYVATAVISSKTAVEYLFKFLSELTGQKLLLDQLVTPTIILVLLGFALLVISGVKDSAKVAGGIFVIHILALLSFITVGLTYAVFKGSFFAQNILATATLVQSNDGLLRTLFLAFSASLLGVSGFESSANFVEEQEPGVFRKTLKNMLIGVLIFNPLISFVTLSVLPLAEVTAAKDFLLADASFKMLGLPYLGLISVNAFLVLCGAVLTSFIGVHGLATRMSLDSALPSILIKENKAKINSRIIITFFVLCSSILVITKGDLLSLAGVYTISFLGVMTMFAFGNLLLRKTRPLLKRPYKAPIILVILALSSTLLGMLGNSSIDIKNVFYFGIYFVPALFLVIAVLNKKEFLEVLLRALKPIEGTFLHSLIKRKRDKVASETLYVFIHHTGSLFEIVDYIHKNEVGLNIDFIHCQGDDWQKEEIEQALHWLQLTGVYTEFNLNFEYIDAQFNPETLHAFAKAKNVPMNKIFIGSIHDFHDFDYEELGGVRIIT
ncbi:MAG: APC family permease [Patescibacteria group bacterium]